MFSSQRKKTTTERRNFKGYSTLLNSQGVYLAKKRSLQDVLPFSFQTAILKVVVGVRNYVARIFSQYNRFYAKSHKSQSQESSCSKKYRTGSKPSKRERLYSSHLHLLSCFDLYKRNSLKTKTAKPFQGWLYYQKSTYLYLAGRVQYCLNFHPNLNISCTIRPGKIMNTLQLAVCFTF